MKLVSAERTTRPLRHLPFDYAPIRRLQCCGNMRWRFVFRRALPPMYKQVLDFWFHEAGPTKWWNASTSFDDEIRERFDALLQQAARGELYEWRSTDRGRLAEVIVLDQFPRNIHRGTSLAFLHDPIAL